MEYDCRKKAEGPKRQREQQRDLSGETEIDKSISAQGAQVPGHAKYSRQQKKPVK
jgi:hypothetical protein